VADDRPEPTGHPPDLDFDSLVVHAGQEPDELTGAVAPPIYQTSTFRQEAVGRPTRGYEYARSQNPTRERLERAVARLEGGRHGIAFASGSAATAALAELVAPGEEVLVGDDVYGGTHRYLVRVAGPRGVDVRFVDLATDPGGALAGALGPATRLVWFETPTNPHLKVVDIAAVAGAVEGHVGARGERPLVVVDGTFASPALQRPLALGADVVFHSSTKYLAGHSDTIGGIAVTDDDAIAERLRFLQNAMGGVPGPFDCFLALRGLRTLAIRAERHCANASAVAGFLAARSDVARVHYPGLADGRDAHPGHAVAAHQMRLGGPDGPAAFGGMVSFVPAAGGRHDRSAAERAVAIAEATRLWILGSVAGTQLEVDPALIRLSVGIESATDLVADLARALDRS
jgi:cystathionine gamma-synthase